MIGPPDEQPTESGEQASDDRHAEPVADCCPLCGAPMQAVHCKLICPTCGYREDCSDLFPTQG